MTIAITGASGALGRASADVVLQAVDPREVVLTTRRPESLGDLAARGVDVRRVDFVAQSNERSRAVMRRLEMRHNTGATILTTPHRPKATVFAATSSTAPQQSGTASPVFRTARCLVCLLDPR